MSAELVDLLKTAIQVLGTLGAAWFSYRAARNSKETLIVAKTTEENTNHLKDELVAEVRKASIALGKKQEQDKNIS